jgi:hypothetical protein
VNDGAADVVMILLPDEDIRVYSNNVEPNIAQGALHRVLRMVNVLTNRAPSRPGCGLSPRRLLATRYATRAGEVPTDRSSRQKRKAKVIWR